MDPPAWQSAADRRVKYGWGFLRLSALTVVVWACMPAAAQLAAYPPGLAGAARLLAHVYLGAVGALVNAALLPLRASLAALALGGALLVADVVAARDAALIFYLLKTALGDAAAGKVDTDACSA